MGSVPCCRTCHLVSELLASFLVIRSFPALLKVVKRQFLVKRQFAFVCLKHTGFEIFDYIKIMSLRSLFLEKETAIVIVLKYFDVIW